MSLSSDVVLDHHREVDRVQEWFVVLEDRESLDDDSMENGPCRGRVVFELDASLVVLRLLLYAPADTCRRDDDQSVEKPVDSERRSDCRDRVDQEPGEISRSRLDSDVAPENRPPRRISPRIRERSIGLTQGRASYRG